MGDQPPALGGVIEGILAKIPGKEEQGAGFEFCQPDGCRETVPGLKADRIGPLSGREG